MLLSKIKYHRYLLSLFVLCECAWADNIAPPAKAVEEEAEQAPTTKLPATGTGEWGGARTRLREKGIEFKSVITGDVTWNLAGGKHRTTWGDYEYLLDASLTVVSEPHFHYSGGTFFIDYQGHHGTNPSSKDVGSYIPVDTIEAPGFDELYALWYKQAFLNNTLWFQVGKSDAYYTFIYTTYSFYFINNGYTTLPTILYLPTYPQSRHGRNRLCATAFTSFVHCGDV